MIIKTDPPATLTSVRFGTEEEQVLVMEPAMKVRGWILRDGRGIRAVARETGLSRTTIKKYLKK